jgi:hypothetical protein
MDQIEFEEGDNVKWQSKGAETTFGVVQAKEIVRGKAKYTVLWKDGTTKTLGGSKLSKVEQFDMLQKEPIQEAGSRKRKKRKGDDTTVDATISEGREKKGDDSKEEKASKPKKHKK